MWDLRISRIACAGAAAMFAACATAAPASRQPGRPLGIPQTGVSPVSDERLLPPEAALRTSLSLTPSGLELGTMWTFENPPLQQWQERYGFTPDAAWLERVRLASLRFGEGCSAAFVSVDGLAATNHHCARECVEALSTAQHDLVETGFYAATRGEEKLCPDLYLDQLVDITDVTQRVRAAGTAAGGSQQAAHAQAAEATRIEQDCTQRTGHTCQVVPLYQGGQYQLYTWRRYAPVKLVFAPELQAGFFGGDPDNFTYPRYAFDISFVRAYESNGGAARTPHFLQWRPQGAAEGEVVFVTGNPGSTSRLITLTQLLYERSYRHPFVVDLLERQRGLLHALAALGPEQERDVRESLFSVENSLKAYRGQLNGLLDTLLVARKVAWEREFRARVAAAAEAREYADVWDRVARIQLRKLELNPVLNLSNAALVGAQHLSLAAQLAGWLRASALPERERAAPYRGDGFARIRSALESTAAIPEAQALGRMRLHLELVRSWVPAQHALSRALLRPDETPAAAAERLVRSSRIADPAWRKSLMAAGAAAFDNGDPLLLAGRVLDSIYDAVLPQWRALVADEAVENARLARALFAVYGTQQPPDATFTLRISDGVIARYPYNGTVAPPKTALYGLYARAAEFDNQMPWRLPVSFQRNRARVDMNVPFNFVSTNDITGGNSGSPVIDREGRVVGIAFDGNIEQLPNEFVFDPSVGRTVSVHAAGILELLRSVYHAQALVSELLGTRR